MLRSRERDLESDGPVLVSRVCTQLSLTAVLYDAWVYGWDHWQKEKQLFAANRRLLLLGVCWQYVHSVMTNVVYWLHVPRVPLKDLGFMLFPALSPQVQVISEIMFFIMLTATIIFAFSPFFTQSTMYTAIVLTRFFAVLIAAQTLRIITFLVTILPGPNYHCRPDSPDYAPPQSLKDIFYRQDAFFGCGDLVFSSHTIFVVLCALTFTRYGSNRVWKRFVWVLVVFFGCVVVSARKHYSIDIVVAFYTVPLLWIACDRFYPDQLPTDFYDADNPSTHHGRHKKGHVELEDFIIDINESERATSTSPLLQLQARS